jgi:transcription elongation factor Elf1
MLPFDEPGRPARDTEDRVMVTLPCPWCDEQATLTLVELTEEDSASFTCAACGTSVSLVEEPLPALDLAA